jgi:hypothetical protein
MGKVNELLLKLSELVALAADSSSPKNNPYIFYFSVYQKEARTILSKAMNQEPPICLVNGIEFTDIVHRDEEVPHSEFIPVYSGDGIPDVTTNKNWRG